LETASPAQSSGMTAPRFCSRRPSHRAFRPGRAIFSDLLQRSRRSATFAGRMRCPCMKSRRQCETANAARKHRGSYENICKRIGCDRRSVIFSSICSGG
jgi:hypothetical protein